MRIETLDDLVKLNGFKKIVRFLKSNGAYYEFGKEFKPHSMYLSDDETIYDFFSDHEHSFLFAATKKGKSWWRDKIFYNNNFDEISCDLMAI